MQQAQAVGENLAKAAEAQAAGNTNEARRLDNIASRATYAIGLLAHVAECISEAAKARAAGNQRLTDGWNRAAQKICENIDKDSEGIYIDKGSRANYNRMDSKEITRLQEIVSSSTHDFYMLSDFVEKLAQRAKITRSLNVRIAENY